MNSTGRVKEEEETRKPHKDFHLLQLRKIIALETNSHFFKYHSQFSWFLQDFGIKMKLTTFLKECFWSLQTFLKKWVIRNFVSKHFYWTYLLITFKTLLINSYNWQRENFSLQCQYNIKQISNENKENIH